MAKRILFSVYDTTTGLYPNLEEIVMKEDWASGLALYCVEGFCMDEDGQLYMVDSCGKMVSCPGDRFKVVLMTDAWMLWKRWIPLILSLIAVGLSVFNMVRVFLSV